MEGECYETFSQNCCFKCASRKDEEFSNVENYEQPTSLKNLMVAEQNAGEVQNCSIKSIKLAKHDEFEGKFAKQLCLCQRE